MNTNCTPQELAVDLLDRSICSVQTSAVLADQKGIFAWGWNHSGEGFGEHAEVHCLKRANPHRTEGTDLFIAARRQRTGKPVSSPPCPRCQGWIESRGIERVWFRAGNGLWHLFQPSQNEGANWS